MVRLLQTFDIQLQDPNLQPEIESLVVIRPRDGVPVTLQLKKKDQ